MKVWDAMLGRCQVVIGFISFSFVCSFVSLMVCSFLVVVFRLLLLQLLVMVVVEIERTPV